MNQRACQKKEADELRRLERLHRAFSEAARRVDAGESIARSLASLRRKPLQGTRRAYSLRSLRRLFKRWIIDRRTEALARRWKSGGPAPQMSSAAIAQALRRIQACPSRSIRSVYQDMAADWCAGIDVPGVPPQRGAEPFPICEATFMRVVCKAIPAEWRVLRRRTRTTLAQQRKLTRMQKLAAARLRRLASEIRHSGRNS